MPPNASPAWTRASSISSVPPCTCTSPGCRSSRRAKTARSRTTTCRVARRGSISHRGCDNGSFALPGNFARPLWVDDDRFDLDFHLRRVGDPVARRSAPVGARGRPRPVPTARPIEAALGALRLRRAGAAPHGGPAEDAPRAGGRDLGHADRLGAVRPLAGRAARSAAGTPGRPSRPRPAIDLAARRRPGHGVPSARGARAGGGGAATHAAAVVGETLGGIRDCVGHGRAAPRSLRRPHRPRAPVRDRRGRRSTDSATSSAPSGARSTTSCSPPSRGGLHELLAARGEPTKGRTLRVLVPVSVRSKAEHGDVGNRVAPAFVDIPVGTMRPSIPTSTVRPRPTPAQGRRRWR